MRDPPGRRRPAPEDLAWCTSPPTTAPPSPHARSERSRRSTTISISTIHAFAAAALGGTLGAVDTADARGARRSPTCSPSPRSTTATPCSTARAALTSPRRVREGRARQPRRGPGAERGRRRPSRAGRTCARSAARSSSSRSAAARQGRHTYADLLTELHAVLDDDDAPLLATLSRRYGRAHRRVPGHRPDRSGGSSARLFLDAEGRTPRRRRRPEAGHLRLPRRRRGHVPRRAGRRRVERRRARAWRRCPRTTGPMPRCCASSTRSGRRTFDEAGAIRYVPVEPAPGAPERAVVPEGGDPAPALSLAPAHLGDGHTAERLRAMAEDCAEVARATLDASVMDDAGATRRPHRARRGGAVPGADHCSRCCGQRSCDGGSAPRRRRPTTCSSRSPRSTSPSRFGR